MKLNKKLRDKIGTYGELPAKEVNPPLFVTGCMRSGTTFLVDKLTSHPQMIKVGDELNQVWTEIGGAKIIGQCQHRSAEDLSPQNIYQMSQYFYNFISESRGFKRYIMRSLNYFKTKRGRIFYDWENIIPVNKSTHLMNKIGYLSTSFPHSKIIIIVRDIYAHSSSMKMHFLSQNEKNGAIHFKPDNELDCWTTRIEDNIEPGLNGKPSFPPNFSLIPQMWINLNLQALKVASLNRDNCIVISYEELIQNQAAIFKKLFSKLYLEEKYNNEIKKINTEIINHKNTTTRGNSLDKWKKYLDKDEIETIDLLLIKSNIDYEKIISLLNSLKI